MALSATPQDRSYIGAAAATPRPIALPRPLLTVVVPTYNERENVTMLVDLVSSALSGVDFEIIFVDDSNDDTPQIIMALKTDVTVKLIHRETWERDGGLTTAIVRGLRAARGTYISVLDGDLQHPPEKLAEMLATAQRENADVVVASRYRTGGSAHGLPGFTRRLISVASKWMSKALFYERLNPTSDPGSGFFLLHRDVIEGVELRPIGYKMLTEILVRGNWETVAEVPYRFQTRGAGDSKAGLRQGLQYLQHTGRIFVEVPDVARLWKFLIVGASGVAVNLALLFVCMEVLGAPLYAAWIAGVEASVLSNFWLNRTFTWRDRRAHTLGGVISEGSRYHVASMIGVGANFIAFSVVAALGGMTLLCGAAGIMAGVAANFVGATRYVFPASAIIDAVAVDAEPEEADMTGIIVLPRRSAHTEHDVADLQVA